MKGWIAGTLLVALAAVAVGTGTIAQEEPPDPTPEPATETTANVEVRVWQDVRDARSIYISARPEDGSWATLGTIPLPLDDGHSSNGRFRYGDITVAVPVAHATKDVEVRVWQAVRNARSIYISARPEGGSWATLGTIPLPLDDGHSSSGRFRYGDITVEVPVPLPSAPTATPTPTPTPTPWVDPRPDDTYTLAELADMPAPRAPEAPPKPDHVMALEIDQGWGLDVRASLVDTARVVVMLSHTYNSREYPVICNVQGPQEGTCSYSENAPFNSSGTRRISFSGQIVRREDISFKSASVDGVQHICEYRPNEWYFDPLLWWCYDPDTYRAWEAARDRALATPDDPLQAYLRQQGDPPLWYDDPPFERIGTSTTGVFRMEPYVNYEYDLTWHDESVVEFHHAAWEIWIQCVPVDRSGRAVISAGTLSRTLVNRERYFVRSESLCDFAVRVADWWEGVVSITFAPEEGP